MLTSMFKTGGMLVSIRNLMETFLATVQNRVELAAVEFREEKSRAVSSLIYGALAMFLAFMTIIVVTLTIVAAFWDTPNRMIVLIAFCIIYFLGALVSFFALRSRINGPPPFSETIQQIKKDRAWLRSQAS